MKSYSPSNSTPPAAPARASTCPGQAAVDVTNQSEAAAELARLATAVNQAAEAIVITDTRGIIEFVNPAFERITGYSAAEAIGRTPRLLKSGLQNAQFYRDFWKTVTSGQVWKGQFTNRRKDGTLYEEEGTVSPVRDEQGRITRFIAVKQDVTAQRRAEAALHQAQSLHRCAISVAGAVAYDYDYRTRKYEYMGDGIELLTGYRPEEICPALWCEIIEDSEMLGEAAGVSKAEAVARVLRGEIKYWRSDMRIRTRGGQTRWLSDISVPKLDEAGQAIGSTGILQDITERKQSEQQIRKLNRTYVVLSAINQLIVRERDPQTILEGACRIAVEKGGFRLALICQAQTPDRRLDLIAHAGATPDTLTMLREIFADPQRNREFTGQAMALGVRTVCNDIEHDPQTASWRDAALQRGYRSLVVLPLKVAEEIIGTFNLYADEPGFFSVAELALLDELAMDIGFALGVSRQEVKRQQAEAARDALLELESKLSAARDPLAAARDIFSAADKLWAFDSGTLEVFNSDQTLLESVLSMDSVEGERREVELAQSIAEPTPRARRIMQHGAELILRQLPLVAQPDAIMFGDTSRLSASILCVPIRWQGRPVGVLSIQSYALNAYSEQDLRTLQGMADHCGGTLERIRADEALRTSEQRFRELAEAVQEVFWITDPANTQMLYISPAYEKIWGHTCESLYAAPRSWLAAVHPDDRARVAQAAEANPAHGHYNETYRIQRPDGTVRWIRDRAFPVRDAAGKVIRLVGTAEDITERQQLEEQFRQAQKMEAVGQLAGGVAHDFNNILAAILMHLGLLRGMVNPDPFLAGSLAELESEAKRAAGLTRQLLLFSRRSVLQTRTLDVNEVVENLLKMLRRLIGEQISLEWQRQPELPAVSGDAGMLEQVVMNLVVNARDASPKGGRIIIATESVNLDERVAASHVAARPGQFVCLSVTDHGCGMDAATLTNIFEPFFTTKEAGKGTGLGLATVYGIAAQHQGWVTVESAVDRGSCFRVYLPALAAATEAGVATEPQASSPVGGRETILLVEDEPVVRKTVASFLSNCGYHVIQANNGPEALSTWALHWRRIDLLFTDMVMPSGMSGLQLADKLRADKPELQVILASGYSTENAGRDFSLASGVTFIAKPFSVQELAATVRAGLDAE